MNSRARVLAALRRQQPDRVPYCESGIDGALTQQLVGWRSPISQASSLEVNPYTAAEAKSIAARLNLHNLYYILRAHVHAEKPPGRDGRRFYGDGMLHPWDDSQKLQMPDADDDVPVIDEDGLEVDYRRIIGEALDLGYQSVMVDGSRLPLDRNMAATREVAEMARTAGVPVEGELGAVLGHETGPLPPYEELFLSGRGFTDADEARCFVEKTRVDWLSVAIGNIHGAISGAARRDSKVRARLNIDHLERIRQAVGIPLALHGGTGIEKRCLLEAARHGIAKINIGMAIRQPFEAVRADSVPRAQEAVCAATERVIREELELEGSVRHINPLDTPG